MLRLGLPQPYLLCMLGLIFVAASSSGAPFTLTISKDHTVGTVGDDFLGVALGSWDKLAQGPAHHLPTNSSVASWPVVSCEEYFERDPRLLEYLKPLSPGYLRFGDMMYFYGGVGDGDTPVPAIAGDSANVTITRQCFDRLAKFTKDAGMSMYLLGNVQYGTVMHQTDKSNCATTPGATGELTTDWTNLRHLLEHAKRSGVPVGAVDIAGEPNLLPQRCQIPGLMERWPHILANATRDLKRVLVEVYPDAATRPKLVGPMMFFSLYASCGITGPEWLEAYLSDVGPELDAISHTWYPSRSGLFNGTAAVAEILTPSYHDLIVPVAAAIVELRDKHAPKTPIWLAETATLSHGGAENVSDRFVSGFWYLAQLGYLASNGYSGMHREQFWDGLMGEHDSGMTGQDYYGLVQKNYTPAPDLYTHILWKRLIGGNVLAAKLDATSGSSPLRAYAFCRRGTPGAVVLVLVNLLPSEAALRLDGLAAVPRVEYILTAPTLTSADALLNGVPLRTTLNHSLPDVVAMGRSVVAPVESMLLPPHSYGFVELPDARARACGAP